MTIFRQEVKTILDITKVEGDNKFINTDSTTSKWLFGINIFKHHGIEIQKDSRRENESSPKGFLKR